LKKTFKKHILKKMAENLLYYQLNAFIIWMIIATIVIYSLYLIICTLICLIHYGEDRKRFRHLRRHDSIFYKS